MPNPPSIVIQDNDTVLVVPDNAPPDVITLGIQGPPGASAALTVVAAQALGGHKAVIANGDGSVSYADAATAAHIGHVVGVTLGAASASAPIDVRDEGRIDEPSWNWNPALPLYLGLNGQLTQTLPNTAAFLQIIGVVLAPTSIVVQLSDPVLL